jgi:hypothetical protein
MSLHRGNFRAPIRERDAAQHGITFMISGAGDVNGGSVMDDEKLVELIKPIKTKELKEELKKRGLKAGRCPTKLDLARLLPDDVLLEMVEK